MLGQALGTYSTTFAWQTGGTTNHDDFGQKSIDIATDLMSGDLAMSGETYGWFSDAARLQCNTTTKIEPTCCGGIITASSRPAMKYLTL